MVVVAAGYAHLLAGKDVVQAKAAGPATVLPVPRRGVSLISMDRPEHVDHPRAVRAANQCTLGRQGSSSASCRERDDLTVGRLAPRRVKVTTDNRRQRCFLKPRNEPLLCFHFDPSVGSASGWNVGADNLERLSWRL